MADDLVFPRLMYRGPADTLGLGVRPDPKTGELIGETKRVESRQEFDDALKDGWRETRDEDGVATDAAVADEAAAAEAAAAAETTTDQPVSPRARNALKR